MATLAAIMTALADQIRDAVDDVTDIDVQVEDRMVLNPTPPSIDVYPGDPSDDQTLAGFGEMVGGELLTIRARVSTGDSVAGQELLLALMDDEDDLSVFAAIESDPTLGGYASQATVRSRSGYTLFPDPGPEGALLGCLWGVVVIKAQS